MQITIAKIANGWVISTPDLWDGSFVVTDPMDGLRRVLDAYEKRKSSIDSLVIEYPKLRSE